MKIKDVYNGLLKHWFILGLIIVILLAAAFPELGKKKGIIHSEYTVSYGCIIIIFLLSGLSLKTKALTDALIYWQLILIVQGISLVFIPAFGYGLGKLLALAAFDANLIRGIVICCSCPTTISSNVLMTKTAGGNEAASLVNAVIGSILGVFVSPPLIIFLLGLNANGGTVDFASIFLNLLETVIIPVIVGQLIQHFFAKYVKIVQQYVNFAILNSSMLLVLVWSVFCDTFSEKDVFGSVSVVSLVLIFFIQVSQFSLYSFICFSVSRIPAFKFTPEDSIAIVMCGATKTVALGIPLINLIFVGNPALGILSIPLLVYHAEQLFVGTLLVTLFQNWLKKFKPDLEQNQSANTIVEVAQDSGSTEQLESLNK
ncbi:hypothetical protein HDV04_005610 [Boothiomyces sp. JEL0838]|nr:hypothetical protein HDV04_005610 [Boothiomyces sp. JEL0838]